MSDVELRSKTELTSIAGTENIYVQEAGSPFTVKRTLLNTIRSWLMTAPSSTVLKSASYAILDNDGYTRIEVDTTSAACTITLPLMANNRGRRIEIAFIKNDASADVVTVSPHATDAGKLSNDLLASIILAKVGDFIVVQESVNSGCWEVVNERITSQLRLNTYAGYGSTDNKIMRFTNVVENVGNMFSENHVSGYTGNAKGLEITINRSGVYGFSFTNQASGGATSNFGLSLNSASLTTDIASIPTGERLAVTQSPAGNVDSVNIELYLIKSSVVRYHAGAVVPSTASLASVIVSYIGN